MNKLLFFLQFFIKKIFLFIFQHQKIERTISNTNGITDPNLLEVGGTVGNGGDLPVQWSMGLDDFELLTVIGRGSYAKVVQAEHRFSIF